ncbi:DUF1523 family protein [Acidimangrovimonas pyrenivorans]|uniref:DUF1523 family protein n=1 Tax=Acidimangrovimonas pyrenivorans TaxID=2030798 RepID=A0ABV7AM64_9RHOB
MGRYIKWGLIALVVLVVGVFLQYTLLSHDVVRITNTYNRITTLGSINRLFYASPDVGTNEGTTTRDIRFIEAVRPNGKVVVYRNEDTGWVWPPYFKYDSSNLQAEASALKSSAEAPKWVVVTRYGWRIPFLTIFPNAIAVKQVASPDVRIVPWVNILVLLVLAGLLFLLWRMWAQFRERTIEPLIVDVEEAWDRVDSRADMARRDARGIWGRFKAWLDTWRGKPRK